MGEAIAAGPHLFLGSRLKRLAEQLQSEAAAVSQRAGIAMQPGQMPLLDRLATHGPATVGDLVRVLGTSQSAVSQTVARLAAAGWIETAAGTDRRERRVALSPAGADLLAQARRAIWPRVEAAVRELLDGLDGPFTTQLDAIEARLGERSLAARAGDAILLEPAREDDIEAVAALMNRAYRGRGEDRGWCTEQAYIEGERTSPAMLRADLAGRPAARLLVWRREHGAIGACVWLEPEDEGTWYLGSLAVDPRAQQGGLGRRMLAAAEDWARMRGATAIRMTVVHVRDTLIAWYERRGYALTGQSEPFPYDDARFGVPLVPGLRFVELVKRFGD